MAINIPFKVSSGIEDPTRINTKHIFDLSDAVPLYDETTDEHIVLPNGVSVAITRKDVNNAVIWTVAPSNINAAADFWSGLLWFDSVAGELFIGATDTGTGPDTHYLASINVTSGAITNIGTFTSDQFSLGSASVMGTERASETTGNFFCTNEGHRFEINESTGALISDTTPVVDGITSNGTETNGILEPNGKYYIRDTLSPTTSIPFPHIRVDRLGTGSAQKNVIIPLPALTAVTGAVYARHWGPNIAILTFATTNRTIAAGRLFDKTDFFRYIDEYLGL